jgi:hypothetical protein
MDELVQRLSQSQHPIEISLRPERTVEAFKRRLDDGYVHVKFTQTRGGTELGVQLDRAESDLSQADFVAGRGKVSLTGDLTLNYVRVRCHAEVDLATLAGTGHLEPLES